MSSNFEAGLPSRNPALRLETWGMRLLLVVASLSIAYAIAYFTLMIRWTNFWVRGPYFASYQIIFLAALTILHFAWMSSHINGPPPVISTVIYSTVAGYAAGLIAMTLYPIFQPDGMQQVAMSLRFPTPEAVVAFLWFPIRLLSWLFGGIAGVILVVISRSLGRSRI